MNTLVYPVAFLAGVITAISPCAYPVLPIVFAGGASGGAPRRPYAIIAGLVTTFVVSLLALTWVLDRLGLPQDLLRNIAIALLFLVAASLIVPQLGRWLERPLARLSRRPGGDLGGGFLLGASLGIVFAPCAGTILTAVAGTAATATGGKRVALAILYSVGVAVTLLAIALLARREAGRLRLREHVERFRVALGVVIAVAALGIAFNFDQKLQTWFPDYTNALQKLAGEKDCSVRKGLGQRCLAANTAHLQDFGEAPNFTGISAWVNSQPLTTKELRGKVVLVDFWTYSCINCLRTLPHLKAWDAAYRRDGLVVVGVHTPEFAFEHVVSNVRKAARELGVRYPVAVDDHAKTWNAYQNSAWPTEYLVDRRGRIREIKEGEGDYGGTEMKIRQLLGMSAGAQLASVKDLTPQHITTPESYLGWERLARYSGSELFPGRFTIYHFSRSLAPDGLTYDGLWKVEKQRIVAGDRARLRLRFFAQNVYLVLGGHGPVQVYVDGAHVRTIDVGGLSRLYTLLRYPREREGLLELRFAPGVSAYAFTFG